MSNNVTLSLPLSATALRLGATLLTDLAAQADVISREHIIGYAHTSGCAEVSAEGTYLLEKGERVASPTKDASEHYVAGAETQINVFDPAGALAEAVAVDPTPEPVITQETLPPVEYETVVTGYAPGPVPFAEGHDQVSYEAANWTIQAMLDAGHLVEVTEQRPLAVAPGASAAPSAPAPAPAAPAASGVVVDKDGLPWDSRIHSDAAEKMSKTGYWKTRRNLPEGYKEEIEAQLRQVMNAGKSEASTTTTTVAVAAPPAPSAPAAPAPAPAPDVSTAAPSPSNPFADFTRWIVSHKLSATDVVLEVQKLGLTSIPDLSKRPDLIPAVVKALQDKGLGL